MNREGHEQTTFFIGPEVEHTPAYSKKTLFVVGYQDPQQVEKLARLHKVTHVFLGANHSFDTAHRTDYFDETWNTLVTHLLDRGFWVTLDYQAHQHKDVLEILSAGVWQSRLFVPLLSVRVPKVETSSPNLTIKIDDVDFKATNPGVWCMHFHEVTDSNRFTDWNDYSTDVTIDDISVDILPMSDKVVPQPQSQAVLKEFETQVLNDASIGLDPDSPSQLKADPEVVEPTTFESPQTKQDVAELYTETATPGTEKKSSGKKAK